MLKHIIIAAFSGVIANLAVCALIRQFACVPGEQLSWESARGGCYCNRHGFKPFSCEPYPFPEKP